MAPHHGKFVAYYRVSTDRQGQSGLGLDAQRDLVRNFLNGGRWNLIGEFTEVESGTVKNRPMLKAALELARKQKATLVVSKMDRLARNPLFLEQMIAAKVPFVCADSPELSQFTAHGEFMLRMLGAVSKLERDMISSRTKAALDQLKKKGKKLGSPRPEIGSAEGVRVIKAKADAYAERVGPIVRDIMRKSGASTLREIAAALTARGIETPRGNADWHISQVSNLLKRIK
jgi:DNA invertase Pin-like site-specific DNA recombinase